MPFHQRRLPALLLAGVLPLLAACENSATAYMVDGREHAVMLVREQMYFWSDKVEQAVIVSRLPQCQRRIGIHDGTVPMQEMEVFHAGDNLWALHQGGRWYLASTEVCRVENWDNPGGEAPGPRVGRFVAGDGKPKFQADEAGG